MSLVILISFHLLLALLILVLVNFTGRVIHNFFDYRNLSKTISEDYLGRDFFVRCLAPSVILTGIVIFLYYLKLDSLINNIWLAVLFYSIIFTSFLFITKRITLLDKTFYFSTQTVSVVTALVFYNVFWVRGLSFILPDETNFRTELWVLLIVFVFSLMNSYRPNDLESYEKRKKFLLKRYSHLKEKYYCFIPKEMRGNKKFEDLFFSVMIIEDFNRGPITRIIERILHPLGLAKTTGIMQIKNEEKPLSDKESIEISAQRILEIIQNNKEISNPWDLTRKICVNYNADDDYCSSLGSVYSEVVSNNKSNEI